jgi:hypothetical protein
MTELQQLADELEQQLRAKHPRLAAYLDMTVLARPLWGGGFEVLSTIYGSAEEADEARRAAVMHKLIEADRGPQ